MAYCTQSDLQKRLPEQVLIQLTDDDGVGAIDEANLAACIADADEEIDASLSMHYTLPFSATPAIVLRMSAELTVCYLYARRDYMDLPKQWAERCAACRRMLDRFADGRLRLDVPDPATDSDNGVEISASRSDRVFTMGRTSTGTTGTLDNY